MIAKSLQNNLHPPTTNQPVNKNIPLQPMKAITRLSILSILALAASAMTLLPTRAGAASAYDIDSASRSALRSLLANNSKANDLAGRSVAILVFPSIKKAGFIVAVQRGVGALIRGSRTLGYFETIGGSYGFQAGIQAYGYALFFLDRQSLQYLSSSSGWNVGGAPSLVIGNTGASGSLGTLNLKKGIVAIFFNQRGLMGGLGLQGSKITQYYPN